MRMFEDFLSVSGTTPDTETQLVLLEDLDVRARDYLAAVLIELDGTPTLCSVPTALAAR